MKIEPSRNAKYPTIKQSIGSYVFSFFSCSLYQIGPQIKPTLCMQGRVEHLLCSFHLEIDMRDPDLN